jgi:hypothetical protein
MKTMKGIIFALALVLFTSCEYIERPLGDDSGNGSLLGSVFEVEGDFTARNNFSLGFEFPKNFVVYETDVVLVYILWEQTTDKTGKVTDVWRLLPQTVVLGNGVLQYNFDYTLNDVQIFLDGTVDFNTLLPAESQDQVFRIVVLPADFAIIHSIDLSNLDLVMKSLSINPEAVKKFNMTEKDSAIELK